MKLVVCFTNIMFYIPSTIATCVHGTRFIILDNYRRNLTNSRRIFSRFLRRHVCHTTRLSLRSLLVRVPPAPCLPHYSFHPPKPPRP